MGVGDDDAGEVRALLLEVGDVGKDHVDAGQSSCASKAMPKSTASQVRSSARTEAVEAEVHADLADPAERQEDEFVGGLAQRPASAQPAAAKKTSPALIVSRTPSVRRSDQATVGVEGLEAAIERAVGKIDADRLADAQRAR